jgi:acyl carrier protein
MLTVATVIAIAVATWFAGGDAKAKRKLKLLFSGREPKSSDQFCERFFSNSDVPQYVVSKIRDIFQEQVPVDLSLLEADDDLSGDFNVIWDLDSLADVKIVVELEKIFDIKITDDEAAAMKSFRMIVSGVWNKLQQKR